MKNRKWNALLGTVAGVALLFGAAGCDSGEGTGNKDYWTMETVFAKAQELGYGGTLEEFKETVKGRDGVGIKNVYIQDGNLCVRFDDDREINCGKVVGADGVDGKDGINGTNGIDGKDGINGTNGIDGKDGADGATWLTGEGVPTAENGKNGDLYLDLSTCDIYKKADGAWSKLCNIKGEAGANGTDGKDGINGVDGKDGINGTNGTDGKDGINGTNGTDGKDGANGADGATWLTGAGVPTAESGKNGDLYLDLSTCDIYKKADGAWSKLCNIKGEAGVNGTNGKDGANGVDGKDGINGTNGTDGKDGANGVDGKDGINGTNGIDGKDGANGADGATWLTGEGVPTAENGKNGDLYLDSLTCDVYKKADGAWNKLCNIKGATGADGKDGTNGTNGKDGADGAAACTHENVGEWETVIKADCDTTGVKKRVCSDCGHIEYEFEAEHGHSLVLIEGTEKTQCEGHVVVYYCNTCGEVVSKYIKGTGHNLVNGACQNDGCDYKENDGGSAGGETTIAAPTESEWNAAFGKLVAAKNYKLHRDQNVKFSDGRIVDYKEDILFTDGVICDISETTRQEDGSTTTSTGKTIYTEENGVLYGYIYNASTDTWSKNASSMTLSKVLANFTDVYEVFKGAYSTATWNSEKGYFFAAEYTFTDDDETVTLTDVIVKIENGYVTMISYSQESESGDSETLTMTFSDYGKVTVTVPKVEDENGSSSGSETTVAAPTESEWNAAFGKLITAKNYKLYMNRHIVYNNGNIYDYKGDILFTDGVLGGTYNITRTNGENVTTSEDKTIYTEENGVLYEYTYNASTDTWSKKASSMTLSEELAVFTDVYEVFKNAYSTVTWDSENGYFYAAEYTFTDDDETITLTDMIVKIENGYVTMISYSQKNESGNSLTLTMTFSDYEKVTITVPEVEDESGNEATVEQE